MKVYADNAATTRMGNAALQAMIPALENLYGNASSIHTVGQEAAARLDEARETVAGLLGAQAKEVYFTSGGTESDNWAIHIAATLGARKNKRHIVTTAFEHHAVLHTLQKKEREGFEVTYLDVHEDGIVRPEEVAAAIREDTALVTIMYANNEIGTVQPIEEIGKICREKGVLFHTDAVQAIGHVDIDVKAQCIDMLSLSAHKFHGPKGTGVLYVRTGVPVVNFIEGGAQERGKRGGTEAVPTILGMAAAMRYACENKAENDAKVAAMRDTLINALKQIPRSRLNGHESKRLPGIVNFCFEGIEGEALLLMLDLAGIAGSSGSACTSGSLDPSHVLLALGLPHEIAHGSLRLSLSEYNTPEEMEYIASALPGIVERLRSMSPVWERIEKGEE